MFKFFFLHLRAVCNVERVNAEVLVVRAGGSLQPCTAQLVLAIHFGQRSSVTENYVVLACCANRRGTAAMNQRVAAAVVRVAATTAVPRGEKDQQPDDATDATAAYASGTGRRVVSAAWLLQRVSPVAVHVPLAVDIQAIFLFFAASAFGWVIYASFLFFAASVIFVNPRSAFARVSSDPSYWSFARSSVASNASAA